MYCKYCSKEIEDKSLSCVHCGKSLSETNIPEDEAETLEIPENSFIDEENIQLSCGNCGEEIKKGESYCGECGKRIIREESQSDSKNEKIKKSLFKKIQISIMHRIILGIIFVIAIIYIILSVLGASVTSRESVISQFNKALASKDIKKISKYISSSDRRIQINDATLKPLMDYIDKNPSWVKNEMVSIELQSQNLDVKNKSTQISLPSTSSSGISGSFLLKYNGKKFIFFNSYTFELKPYFLNVSTNIKDAKIFLNGKEVCTSDSEDFFTQIGPYLPGLYEIESSYNGPYVKLENKKEISLIGYNNYNTDSVVNTDLLFDVKYLKIDCNFKDAKLYANGKDTGLLIKDANQFGPVDSSVKLKAVRDFPWGTVASAEVQPGYSSYINIPMIPSEDEVKNAVMDTITNYNKSWVQASVSRDASMITNASAALLASNKKYIENMISGKEYYTGKLTKIVFDLDSIEIFNDDGKFYLTITDSEFYNSANYYENEKGVKTSLSNPKWRYYLVYDEQSKKWLVNNYSSAYGIGNKNIKEFKFD